jgi:predicted RNA-binding Zn-ribbon protein involved in translation (DUF1610 family)|tara:strand:+ start:827 stop:973 length:147 start_codon:yes stop_codon:yes gene_type:complete
MTECYSCGLEFEVKCVDTDAVVKFCPLCGIDIEEEFESQLEMDLGEDE